MMRPDELRSGISPVVVLAALALAASFVLPAAVRGESAAEPRPGPAENCPPQLPRAL
jgi:hypothetical protein